MHIISQKPGKRKDFYLFRQPDCSDEEETGDGTWTESTSDALALIGLV